MPDHPDPTIPGPTPPYEEFVRLFVAHEGRLRAFIRSLLPTWADVDEVMQETSLVAWRKFGRFERGTNFMAWVGGSSLMVICRRPEEAPLPSSTITVIILLK